MNILAEMLDLRTVVYVLTTVFVIISGWFGLKERVSIMAADIAHNKNLIQKQDEYFKCIKKDVRYLQDSIIRIQVLLEQYLQNKNKETN
ncbi:hypothetical protein J7L67_08870 [bacterium]|nr:hypothetical protein [bacterium]